MRSEFSPSERAAVYRAIRTRRDVRADFTSENVPDDVRMCVLEAAHLAPSVGLSQPWRFIVVRDAATRRSVRDYLRRPYLDAFNEGEALAPFLPPSARFVPARRTRTFRIGDG
jgi:5,6-dimethylbenzimidazole synthase